MSGIDVSDLIDGQPISGFQIKVFLLCGMIVVLDGIDYQVIGIAAPLLSAELGIAKPLLAWIFAAGALGAAIGGLTCGPIADRHGRKRVLVATSVLAGAGTMATSLADGFTTLVLLRLVTGFGLGGAVPCFIALTSEYAPQARRASIISLLWAAFPFGGMIGGFVNAYLIGRYHWQSLFYVWGAASIAAAIVLAVFLPESIRFLIDRGRDDRRVAAIVRRLARQVGSDFSTPDASKRAPFKSLIGQLLTADRAPATVSLWIAMFVLIGGLTVITTWSPTLLAPHGFSPADAATIVALHGLGSFAGTSGAGRLIERFGLARIVVPALLLGATGVYCLGSLNHVVVGVAACVSGVFLGLSSSSGVALSALIYPASVRSTGTGWAMGFGRFGAVACPVAVGALLAAGLGTSDVFGALAVLLLAGVPCVLVLSARDRRQCSSIAISERAMPFGR